VNLPIIVSEVVVIAGLRGNYDTIAANRCASGQLAESGVASPAGLEAASRRAAVARLVVAIVAEEEAPVDAVTADLLALRVAESRILPAEPAGLVLAS